MVVYVKGPQTQHKSICAGGSTVHGKWGPVYNWEHRGRPQAPPQVLGVGVAPPSAPSGRDQGLSVCTCTHVWGVWGACTCHTLFNKQLNLFLPWVSPSLPLTSCSLVPPHLAPTGATADVNTGILLWVSAFRKLEEVSPPLEANAVLQEPHADHAFLEAGPQAPSRHRDMTATLTVQLGKEGLDCTARAQ